MEEEIEGGNGGCKEGGLHGSRADETGEAERDALFRVEVGDIWLMSDGSAETGLSG